jgi:UDP-N-acetylmuramoylalanine--D-glutamate ligase
VSAPEGSPAWAGQTPLEGQRVLVLGLGMSGRAAADLLLRRGARVEVLDDADTPGLREAAETLRARGATVRLGGAMGPDAAPDLAVVSPGVAPAHPVVADLRRRGVPVIGELELGYENARCLNVAITGTNGKSTTVRMVAALLGAHRMKTLAAGNLGTPLCAVADRTPDLDFLTIEASAFQLETTRYFRPAVGVLLNITPDHLDRYGGMAAYARAKARLFENQQTFDWAIIQSEALALLRAHQVNIPSKIITFSASNRRADLYLDRSLIISRRDDWAGPLLNLERCRLSGPHQAENMMAALAVGRVLRIPLEVMAGTLQEFQPAPHRCEVVAEVAGVRYVNDSKATNLGAVQKALLSMPASAPGEPNVWLIAGGRDKAFEYYEIGPLLSQRVKGAFLLGETRERLRAAWSLFTPCTLVDTLVEAVAEAARQAAPGDVVLLSPACSSFDQFQDYQHRGEVFRQAVQALQGPGSAPVHPDQRT